MFYGCCRLIAYLLVLLLTAVPNVLAQSADKPEWYPQQVETFKELLGERQDLINEDQSKNFGKWLKDNNIQEDWWRKPSQRQQAETKLKELGVDISKVKDAIIMRFSSGGLEEIALKNYCGKRDGPIQYRLPRCTSTWTSRTLCKKGGCCEKNTCNSTCKAYYDILVADGKTVGKPCP